MRRKYDLRNKRNFIIILFIAIAVIGVFSLFIYKYMYASKIEYIVETGSVVQDDSKNYISIDEDAKLKIRWNDNYYLIYQDNKMNLGKKVIVFNTITNSMKLYGKFYEIDKLGKIIENNNETILNNTFNNKFYKLDDRKYLLIDKQIVSDDRTIEASNYMLVELDKMGNAKLSNNKLNLKTISPTILVTSEYTFDIANEILKYGSLNIDLKKIIGSTNQYVQEEDKNNDKENDNKIGDNNTENNNPGNGVIGTGTGDWNGAGGAGNVINNTDTGNVEDIGEIKNKTKMTSIIRTQEGLSQIDVDYVIYDPYNEYKSVYAEVIMNDNIDVIYLSKNDTHIVFDNLIPNTKYRINFVYTTINEETNEVIPTTFDSINLTTKMPKYSINVYKISNVSNLLTYRVYLQEGYSINKVNVSLSFKYIVRNEETDEASLMNGKVNSTIQVVNNSKYIDGVIDLSNYDIDKNSILTLNIDSIESNSGILDINSSYTFRIGR